MNTQTPCQADPDMWFSEAPKKIEKAKAGCASCHPSLSQPCLTVALTAERGESIANRHGIYAGTEPRDRFLMGV